MKENYMMIEGKKINISDETAKELVSKFSKKELKVFRLVQKQKGEYYEEGTDNWMITLGNGMDEGSRYEGFLKSGNYPPAYLPNCDGQWYDEDGNEIGGYLYFKPRGE